MSTFKLSICITMYNAEKYIRKCLYSILTQMQEREENDLELIIVDDGSKDTSAQLIKEILQHYPYINSKIYSQKNGGVSSARNRALSLSTGEYIWFIDSDDYIEQDAVATILYELKKEMVDLYVYPYQILNKNYQFVIKHSAFDAPNILAKQLYTDVVYHVNKAPFVMFFEPGPWHFIVKRSKIINPEIHFVEKMIYEDLNWYVKLCTQIKTFKYIDKVLYNYILTDGSIMRNEHLEKRRQIIASLKNIIQFYQDIQLFDTYKEELEYLVVKHCHYIYQDIFSYNRKSPILKEISDFLNITFPKWLKNKYIKGMGSKNIFLYLLELMHYPFLLNILKVIRGSKK